MVTEGDKGQDVLSRVDPQLLRMALSAYPKLKAALFPQTGPRVTSVCDVSLYHLMQVHTVYIIPGPFINTLFQTRHAQQK